jgi:hypothetical protein
MPAQTSTKFGGSAIHHSLTQRLASPLDSAAAHGTDTAGVFQHKRVLYFACHVPRVGAAGLWLVVHPLEHT